LVPWSAAKWAMSAPFSVSSCTGMSTTQSRYSSAIQPSSAISLTGESCHSGAALCGCHQTKTMPMSSVTGQARSQGRASPGGTLGE